MQEHANGYFAHCFQRKFLEVLSVAISDTPSQPWQCCTGSLALLQAGLAPVVSSVAAVGDPHQGLGLLLGTHRSTVVCVVLHQRGLESTRANHYESIELIQICWSWGNAELHRSMFSETSNCQENKDLFVLSTK
jgi:hypothetical protein